MSAEFDGVALKEYIEARSNRTTVFDSASAKERFMELFREYDEMLCSEIEKDLIKFKDPDIAGLFVPKNTYTYMVLNGFVVSGPAAKALDVCLNNLEILLAEEIIASQLEPTRIGIFRARVFNEIVENPPKNIHALRSIVSWALEMMDEKELGKHWPQIRNLAL